MPVVTNYPGIYVEEIPSGVHPIVGVSTSVGAFIGPFPRGLTIMGEPDDPPIIATHITSFGDFVRVFGGLDVRSEASYAIQQFYLNGGQEAWVVRIFLDGMKKAIYTLQGGSPVQDTLVVKAKSPGVWGNNLQIAVDYNTTSDPSDPSQIFNLTVQEIATTNGKQRILVTEIHRNLTMNMTKANYAKNVVQAASTLIDLEDRGLGDAPGVTGTDSKGNLIFKPLGNGSDGSVLKSDGKVMDYAAFSAAIIGDEVSKTGLHALDRIAPFIFNILCLPDAAKLDAASMSSVYSAAETYCDNKRAFLIIDIPPSTSGKTGQQPVKAHTDMIAWMAANDKLRDPNAAVYFPQLQIPDPLNNNQLRERAASGTVAGIIARTDSTRGVWKAPAGTETGLRNANVNVKLTDLENGQLNPLGINVLRSFPIFGPIIWGGRTLFGADQQANEWKYIPVRRMALFLEESLYQGLKWVVFEPNDEPLWAQIRLNVGAFMQNLFRQGAFQGKTPREAYLVKCDSETTTQSDINLGIVNILVGFAPLKPAEFVILQIEQLAGQIQV